MAKAKTTTAEEQPGALQTVSPNDVIPADMLEEMQQDAGMGVSFKQEDQLLPLIYVLQTNSPIVNKRGDNYIDGAEPGHFWLRNALEPIRNGEDGIDVIPCVMQRTWIEWLPNRGGFVARHDQPPPDMDKREERDDNGRMKTVLYRKGNGNIIQDTREFFLLIEGHPYVLPCTGTKHTFARQWQSMFHQFRLPRTGDVLPAFAHKYRLTTIPASNAIGEWFGLKFQDLGIVNKQEYAAAKAFCKAVEKGEKRAEAPIDGSGEALDDKEIPY